MTDPTNANKLLVALAERASKRRKFKKEEFPEKELPKEESIQDSIQSEFKPRKKNQSSLKEEFPPVEIEYSSEGEIEKEEDSDLLDNPLKAINRYRPKGRTSIREPKKHPKILNRFKNLNPENAGTFEEQVDLVGNLLCDKLSAFQSISALKITQDWIDCIVDENDSLYEEVYKKLILLNKEQLLGYIRILVSTLK